MIGHRHPGMGLGTQLRSWEVGANTEGGGYIAQPHIRCPEAGAGRRKAGCYEVCVGDAYSFCVEGACLDHLTYIS
jgi:hypothetical protein